MQQRTLGTNGLSVSAIGYGCMGLSGLYGNAQDAESEAVLQQTFELGVNFFDTADVYGDGHNEELVGRALKGVRDQLVIASKCGFLRDADGAMLVNGNPDYIRSACDASLQRLGTDHIDLYYLHRVDPAVPVEDSVGALAELVKAGKVRHIGLSQTNPETLRRGHAVHPIAALQSEYSLWVREPEDDVIPVCEELGIGFVPFCPLGRGFLTRRIRSIDNLDADDLRLTVPRMNADNMETNEPLLAMLDALSAGKGLTPGHLALAWLLHKGETICPIPGSRRIKHNEENAGAAAVALSDQEIAEMDRLFPIGVAAGSNRPTIVHDIEAGR
jgi:aryl-alcohol dehydrogenase-like predicted oxidoreductase